MATRRDDPASYVAPIGTEGRDNRIAPRGDAGLMAEMFAEMFGGGSGGGGSQQSQQPMGYDVRGEALKLAQQMGVPLTMQNVQDAIPMAVQQLAPMQSPIPTTMPAANASQPPTIPDEVLLGIPADTSVSSSIGSVLGGPAMILPAIARTVAGLPATPQLSQQSVPLGLPAPTPVSALAQQSRMQLEGPKPNDGNAIGTDQSRPAITDRTSDTPTDTTSTAQKATPGTTSGTRNVDPASAPISTEEMMTDSNSNTTTDPRVRADGGRVVPGPSDPQRTQSGSVMVDTGTKSADGSMIFRDRTQGGYTVRIGDEWVNFPELNAARAARNIARAAR